MTVLMFGWEFPPHISGGLGTACFGLSKALIEEDVNLLFVVPRAHGNESIPLINASDVVVGETATPGFISEHNSHGTTVIAVASALKPYAMVEVSQSVEDWNWQFRSETIPEGSGGYGTRYNFSGKYGPTLLEEVHRYAEVAAVIAKENEFDIIHAHDWLTYLAGIEAKRISGKPLVVHVHATEFDRAGALHADPRVIAIEKSGMTEADVIIAVSQWTKDIITEKYGIDPDKIQVVHNGVIAVDMPDFPLVPKISEHVVTFLGRVTYQKGPAYFIEAAKKVLEYFPDTHFVMAGSGDLLPAMIDNVTKNKLSSRIHFTGFLRGKQIQQVWSITDVYVMPSVSEPFGITPLEAVQAGVPVIVSNQSGVAEVMDHAIKVDFWDTAALADAIINVLKYSGLSKSLKNNSQKEVSALTWQRAARKLKQIYHEM